MHLMLLMVLEEEAKKKNRCSKAVQIWMEFPLNHTKVQLEQYAIFEVVASLNFVECNDI